jgi:vacuolar-type H+-ATPase subunit H
MTPKKSVARQTSKKSPKITSGYQTVRVFRETGEKLADRIEDYKAKYIHKPVKRSKAFIDDLNANPRKTIDSLADDSRELLADLRKDARKKVDGYLKDGRKFYRQARKDPRKTLDNVVEEGREVFEDLGAEAKERVDGFIQGGRELFESLEKDSRTVADRLQASGKKALEHLPGRAADTKGRPLLIKKYVNGRFYDTVSKKYLKQEDLVRLVKKGAPIRIIASKTGRDITRSVVSGLAVESRDGAHLFLTVDELVNWFKKNQKRIQATVKREVNTFRKAMKSPA